MKEKKNSESELTWAKKLNWTKTIWKPKDALVEIDRNTIWLFTGQTFDEQKIRLVKNGWTHDHCDICSKEIRENDSCATSDNQIICEECHVEILENKSNSNPKST